MSSSKVTETVARLLQCLSVLVSLQSGDEAQRKMGVLCKELKYNWLGRGRTGRQRRGFVGGRRGGGLPPVATLAASVDNGSAPEGLTGDPGATGAAGIGLGINAQGQRVLAS